MSKFVSVDVLNLATGKWINYGSITMTPEKAVMLAWFQYTKKNFNWWNYDWDKAPLKYGVGGRTVFCGDFSAMLPGWKKSA